jgi:superfamily II DNA/RNA helicase
VPTRELALQVQRALVPLAKARRLYVLAIYGGAATGPQVRALHRGASIVVATPGRLQDLVDQGTCDLSQVQVLVVDEADRMADMGFLPQVRRLLDRTPASRQTMLWSATLDGDVDTIVRNYQRDPRRHELAPEPEAVEVEHHFHQVDKIAKVGTAAGLLRRHGSGIVFCRTKHGADRVARQLAAAGVPAAAIHGDRSQAQRERALEAFRAGDVAALVATDVAARGIHVDRVPLVLHWDPVDDHKDYVHRSGRTGRAGATGVVVSLVTDEVKRKTLELQRRLGLPQGLTSTDAVSPSPAEHAMPTPVATPRPEPRRPEQRRSEARAADFRPNRADRRRHLQPGAMAAPTGRGRRRDTRPARPR